MVWEWNWVENPRLPGTPETFSYFTLLDFSIFYFHSPNWTSWHLRLSSCQTSDYFVSPASALHWSPAFVLARYQRPLSNQGIRSTWLIFRGIRQPGIPVSSTGSNPTEKNRNMTHYFWITFVPWRYANSTPDTKQWIEIKSLHFVSICSTDSNPIIDISDTFFCEKRRLGSFGVRSSFLPPPFFIVFMSSLGFPLSQPDNPQNISTSLLPLPMPSSDDQQLTISPTTYRNL